MAKSANADGWTMIIRPRSGLLELNLRELIRYRDLVWLFVKRDVATVYKQTVLGPLWFVIQPLMTTFIYSFVFGRLAGLSTDGVPRTLFYFSGTMLWHYFQLTLTNVSDTFVQNAHIFGKVYFPRLTVPLSKALSNMVALAIQMATFGILYAYYSLNGLDARPGWGLAAIPLIVLWLAALAGGFGMLVSALTKKYRDIRQLLTFGVQLWMYATPVVYPMSQLGGKHRWVFVANPVSAPLELFRSIVFGTAAMDASFLAYSVASGAIILLAGIILFQRNERTFVDTV